MAKKRVSTHEDKEFLEYSGQGIAPIGIEEEMKKAYLDYAMSVIVGRALPDVRDGFKPVHRRVMYAMKEMGLYFNRPFKKSAAVVGDVLGKYHPHGDMAVYNTMVRMVQEFSLRYPLIKGQGNFGSMDGDSAAAYRYTEVKMQNISDEMLRDIDKNTVDFVPNFDGSKEEPSVLPAVIPNLLINGSTGIAVGMATNIPPHNLTEVLDGILHMMDNMDCSIEDLNAIVQGPDFPTGATICGRKGIRDAYETGRGSVKIRAKYEIEETGNSKEQLVFTEVPYQVNKANLLKSIADLVKDKKITGISDLRDESNKNGIRMVVELKKDENAQIVVNQLYKHTQLESSFGIIMLALVNNRPKVLNLKEILEHYLDHRIEVTTRRIQFDLDKAEARAHILEGLKIALDNIDRVIAIIRGSKDADTAKNLLMEEFKLSLRQSQAILDMRLQQLTGLEREKLEAEYNDLLVKIAEFKAILEDEQKLLNVIREELKAIKKKYGDERKTEITAAAVDIDIEDLIDEEDIVVTISNTGYVKRMPMETYRAQNRGGKGVTGMKTKEEDFVKDVIVTTTHAYLLFFTNFGKVHWLKAYNLPDATRHAKGKAIINLIQLQKDEEITAAIPIREFTDVEEYLVMATKNGLIKKTRLSEYSRPRKNGVIAITLNEGDTLVDVKKTNGEQEIVIASKNGLAIHFEEKDARAIGRTSKGVIGIRLKENDEVIGMDTTDAEGTFLVATENGFGKRTKISAYRLQGRGGKGVINIKTSARNGQVIGVKTVKNDDEIILVTEQGMVIRQNVGGISVIGRNAQGVRLIKMNNGDRLVGLAKIEAVEKQNEK